MGLRYSAGTPFHAGHPDRPSAFKLQARRGSGSSVYHKSRGSAPGPPRCPAGVVLTREMVSGALKSRPPTRRKPQGEGPRRVTEWGIAGRSYSQSWSRTRRSRRRHCRCLAAAPRPRPARPRTPPPHSVLSAPRAHRLALRALNPSHFGGSEDRPSLSQAAPITPNPLIEVPRIGSAPMSRSRLAAEPSRLWKLRQQALAL